MKDKKPMSLEKYLQILWDWAYINGYLNDLRQWGFIQ